MPEPHAAVRPEELLRHRAWVRSLARTLVRDEASVDDVEQDVWVTALERPPHSGEAAAAWLARVVRNRVIDLRRARMRRGAREERVARGESTPSAADTVALAEAHRRVVAAVMDLDEPHRTAVLLRYFEDLPPREIGRRTGVPAETARTHVKRGVARLRAALGEDTDDRAALLLLVGDGRAPYGEGPGRPRTRVGAAAGGGLLVMTVTSKLVLAACVASIVIGLAWSGSRSSDAPESDAGSQTAHIDVPDAGERRRPRERAGDATEAIGVATPGATAEEEPATARRLVVRGADGAPLAGVPVLLLTSADEAVAPPTHLSADGSLELPRAGDALRLLVAAPDRAPQCVDVPLDATEVTLPAGVALAGRLTLNGRAPGERVRIGLWLERPVAVVPAARRDAEPAPDGSAEPRIDGRSVTVHTDLAGNFRIEGLAADAAGSISPPWGYTIEDGAVDERAFERPRIDVRLRCTRAPRLAGRVAARDAASSFRPGRVRASGTRSTGGWTTTVDVDDDGAFAIHFPGPVPPSSLTLEVLDASGIVVLRMDLDGPFDVDRDLGTLEIEDPWTTRAHLRIVDAAGKPVAGAFAVLASGWRSAPSSSTGGIDLPGRAALERVVVAAPGHGFTEISAPGADASCDVVLPAAATLRIAPVVIGGDALSGRVTLRLTGTDLLRQPEDEFLWPLAAALRSDGPDTQWRGDDGIDHLDYIARDAAALTVPWLRPGARIRVAALDALDHEIAAEDVVAPFGGVLDVRLVLPAIGALRGRVQDESGRPVAGALVFARDSATGGDDEHDDTFARARTDDAGEFVLPGLCCSAVALLVEAEGRVPWARRAVPVPAPPGESSGDASAGDRGDALIVTLHRGRTLDVRVTGQHGELARDCVVWAVPSDPERFEGQTVEFWAAATPEGVQRLTGLPGEPVVVIVEDADGNRQRIAVEDDRATLDVVLPPAPDSR